MIPGSNLLDIALSVIATQTVTYYRWLSRTTKATGLLTDNYAAPVELEGSFQPVPQSMYEQYGLDFSRTYATFYCSTQMKAIDRDISADYIVYAGGLYKCESPNDWLAVDGWNGVLCVKDNLTDLSIFGFSSTDKNFNNGAFGA